MRPKLVVNDPTLVQPHGHAHVCHRPVRRAQQRGRPLEPPREVQVLVGRLTEHAAELTAEVRRRQVGSPCHVGDAQPASANRRSARSFAPNRWRAGGWSTNTPYLLGWAPTTGTPYVTGCQVAAETGRRASGDPTWRSWQGEAMQIGVVYPQIELGGDPEAVRRIGRATEELGFDHLLAYDHVLGAVHADRVPPLVGPYTERDPFHDPLVMFAHVAAMTERIGFVTGILILPQRQTALVARQAADVDLLSGGRLRLGVGIGWNYVEYETLGQDFRTRGARGRADRVPAAVVGRAGRRVHREIRPRRPRVHHPQAHAPIPIWLGGYGDAAYERAARVGDGFIFGGRTEEVFGAWDRMRDRVVEAGRPVERFGGEYVVMSRKGPEAGAAKIAAWVTPVGTRCGPHDGPGHRLDRRPHRLPGGGRRRPRTRTRVDELLAVEGDPPSIVLVAQESAGETHEQRVALTAAAAQGRSAVLDPACAAGNQDWS